MGVFDLFLLDSPLFQLLLIIVFEAEHVSSLKSKKKNNLFIEVINISVRLVFDHRLPVTHHRTLNYCYSLPVLSKQLFAFIYLQKHLYDANSVFK